jgi:hypothetical protein
LVASADDMGVVLGKAADPRKAVECAAAFVSVNGAEFGPSDRQFAVTADPGLIYKKVERAVHGLDAVWDSLHLHWPVHGFREEVEVAAGCPQSFAGYMGCENQFVAAFEVLIAPIVLDDFADKRSFRVPENQTRSCLFVEGKEVEVFTEFAVVSLFGLFNPLDVLVQLFLGKVGGSVYSAEHGAAFVTAPVSPCHVGKFEDPYMTRAWDVRSGTPVHEAVVCIG